MKGLSSLLLVVAGVVVAPFMVGLTNRFLGSTPPWFPYVVVLLFMLILFAVGVDIMRPFSMSVALTTVIFGLLVQWYPQRVDFLNVNVRAPF